MNLRRFVLHRPRPLIVQYVIHSKKGVKRCHDPCLCNTTCTADFRAPLSGACFSTTRSASLSHSESKSQYQGTSVKDASEKNPRVRISLVVVLLLSAYGIYNWTSSTSDDITCFRQFRLESREHVSSTSAMFTVSPVSGSIEKPPRDQIWSVEFKQPYIQIGRDYTPLPRISSSRDTTDDSLTFLIRKDPKGEMSKYLSGLPIGAKLDVRGPKTEFQIRQNVRHLVFIAGGTGIAPALQAADAVLSGSSQDRTVHVLWANRRREDCLGAPHGTSQGQGSWLRWVSGWSDDASDPKKEPYSFVAKDQQVCPVVHDLNRLQKAFPGRLKVDYFVDEEHRCIDHAAVTQALSRVKSEQLSTSRPWSPIQVIVSGPEGFISYIAGPRPLSYTAAHPGLSATEPAASQGPLGGLLAKAGATKENGINVYKL